MLRLTGSGWGALLLGSILLAQVDTAAAQGSETPPDATAPDPGRDAEARGLFEAGRAAFSDGRFEDALRYFRQSHDLSHRSELLYNIGSAADRLQLDAEALAAFEQYLEELPDAQNRREVEGRIRVLREHVARQQVERDRDAAAAAAAMDASTAPVVDPLADQGEQPSGGGVETEWWFWTLIVVGVAGAGVLAGVLVATSQETTYPPYVTGDEGAIAFTLTVPVPTP